jgi:hypothetical protein
MKAADTLDLPELITIAEAHLLASHRRWLKDNFDELHETSFTHSKWRHFISTELHKIQKYFLNLKSLNL